MLDETREKLEKFTELEKVLFERVEIAVLGIKTKEGIMIVRYSPEGPVAETMGFIEYLDEEINQELQMSKKDIEILIKGTDFITAEDKIWKEDFDLSTTVAIRDRMCELFSNIDIGEKVEQSVIVGYVLKGEKFYTWRGELIECLGLLSGLRHKIRINHDELFADIGEDLEESMDTVLEIKTHESGQVMFVLTSSDMGQKFDGLRAAGFASLVKGKMAQLMVDEKI